MRYKTFRNLVLAVGVVAVGALVTCGIRSCSCSSDAPPPPPPPVSASGTPAAPTRVDSAPAPAQSSGAVSLRPMDRAILALAGTSLSGDKKKDALRGQPYKVNLYQDAGSSTPNRAKIDLDRDGKWDEKWSFEPDGKVKRQVAPADDERYTEEWRRDGERWVSGREPAPAPETQPASAPARVPPGASAAAGEGIALRPFDSELAALGGRTLSGDKLKDALPGRPFKVNLYQDSGKQKVNRLKLDLDRDEKWDEKWSFEEEGGRLEVKRQVAPADDERYSEEYRLRAGRWQKK